MIAEAFRLLHDDAGMIPLHQQALAWGVSKKVQDGAARRQPDPFYWVRMTVALCARSARMPRRGASAPPNRSWLQRRRAHDAGLRHPPAVRSARGHAGRGADRLHAVPLRRRSRQPDGRARTRRSRTGRGSGSELGLDDPILVQFARFVGNAVRFDFGISYQVKQPVTRHDRRALAGDHGAGAWRPPCLPSRSAFRWASIPASTATAGCRRCF